jgi:MFS transporter, FHS family, L-fucose permease
MSLSPQLQETSAKAAVQEQSKMLLWLLFASYFTFGIVLNVVGVVIPLLIQQYHLSLFVGGLLAFAFYISFGVCSIPSGLLTDRFGSRPIVIFGISLMGLGCAAIACVNSFAGITIFAFIIGSGVAFLQTAGNPLVERLDVPQNYHRNLTLTIGFCGIGAFAGPIALSLLQQHGFSWRSLYAGFAVLCFLLGGLLFLSKFPENKSARSRLDLTELVRLLRNPIAITYSFAIFFYVGAEVGTASWIVKFFEQVEGLRVDAGSGNLGLRFISLPALTVSLFWGLQGVGRLISAPLINWLGPRSTLRLYSFGALGCLLLALHSRGYISAGGFAACGFFTSVLFTLLFSGAIQTFRESQGAMSGLLITASIGGAIVPPLVGLVADHVGLPIAMILPVTCLLYVLVVSLMGKATYE